MKPMTELCQSAIATNNIDLALMLISFNSVSAKISSMIGMDVSSHAVVHDAMLAIIVEAYPNIHHAIHSIETPLEFTFDSIEEDE